MTERERERKKESLVVAISKSTACFIVQTVRAISRTKALALCKYLWYLVAQRALLELQRLMQQTVPNTVRMNTYVYVCIGACIRRCTQPKSIVFERISALVSGLLDLAATR